MLSEGNRYNHYWLLKLWPNHFRAKLILDLTCRMISIGSFSMTPFSFKFCKKYYCQPRCVFQCQSQTNAEKGHFQRWLLRNTQIHFSLCGALFASRSDEDWTRCSCVARPRFHRMGGDQCLRSEPEGTRERCIMKRLQWEQTSRWGKGNERSCKNNNDVSVHWKRRERGWNTVDLVSKSGLTKGVKPESKNKAIKVTSLSPVRALAAPGVRY